MSIRKILLSQFMLLVICSSISFAGAFEQSPAVKLVDEFYRRYLAFDHTKTQGVSQPDISLSKAFSNEVKKSTVDCKRFGEGPCGWGDDGDKYLDTQEIDPNLTYSNSRISIKEISLGTVRVKLNVYPSEKNAVAYYNKTITYKIIFENEKYVVDDIAYSDGISMRKKLLDERAYIRENVRKNAMGTIK
ncbi:hypothetical protein [Undibacterium flavidum]|uniref:DUF3828 domain-containing protein n=1 Tax=Undibacterium flavidum TaxID=2762297 RepID=A0ABR6YF33_9BURK|nr:hypothetical protein [Undibacterium flavidum]MBC3875089.1 hypothetical protein [Undibacterium flavidum]